MHSANKWVSSLGNTIAGVVIDSGKFDWTSGRFLPFTSPAEGSHGLNFSEMFREIAYAVKLCLEIPRDIGACLNPFGAFLLLRGLETLSLRTQCHSDNGLTCARYLHCKVNSA